MFVGLSLPRYPIVATYALINLIWHAYQNLIMMGWYGTAHSMNTIFFQAAVITTSGDP